jgi:glucose/arabinose dehydrogenase/PKD repeat protein
MPVRARLFHVVSSLVLLVSCQSSEPIAERVEKISVPSGFTDTVVTTGVAEPTALAFLPSGTILVTGRAGKVRVIKNGTNLLSTPAVDLSSRVCPERERGLLGITVDPDFNSNKQVYVYYTAKHANCNFHDITGAQNRVSRFTYDTSTDRMTNEVILLDHILSWHGWHNAGHIQFGADGYLYIGVGDSGATYGTSNTGWSNTNARSKSILNAKILRVKKENGEPAPGNPWLNAPGARRCGDPNGPLDYPLDNSKPCKETFAWGLRNPFRIPFKPGTNTFFINEVGQNIGGDWEEINEGKAGADYGWNRNQGRTSDASTTNPVYAYEIGEEVNGNACRCITGGAFTPDDAYPSSYNGSYFFGDYTCGVLFKLAKNSSGNWTRSTFASGFGGSSLVELAFGPNPNGGTSLYYTSFNGNKVGRIDGPSISNRAPVASFTATPRSGSVPLTVQFDGSASSDPDSGDHIVKYAWSFGDGSSQNTTGATVSHTYHAAGQFSATLTVTDSRTPPKSGSTSLDIQPGNTPPTVSITGPGPDKLFAVGEHILVTASASDSQDGALSGAAISWDIKKVHDDHTHPFLSGTGASIDVVPDGPESDAGAADLSFLRIKVTATDSTGLSSSATMDLQPHKVPLTFQTDPAGLKVRVAAADLSSGAQITAWEGWELQVSANPQVVNGRSYVFDGWSDGGAATHVLRAPGAATTYVAKFKEAAFVAKINFQLGSALTPAGYLEDDGAAFHAQNGLSYGWDVDNSAAARERNNPASPDKLHDTTILMQKAANRKWEIAVPNGTYHVHLVAGDADYFDSTFDITAEGQAFLSGTPTTANRWIEASGDVTVSDGRLTLDNGAAAHNNKLCFVEISASGAPPPPPSFKAKVNFQPATAPAYGNGYLVDDGTVYANRGGGLSYGWNADNSAATRDRESALAQDQRYDTCILPQKTGNKFWEIAVPNGTYKLRLVAGDAGFFDSVFDFTAEGTTVLSGTPTTSTRWIESNTTVNVSDGRLTIDNGPTARNNKLGFIEIEQQ